MHKGDTVADEAETPAVVLKVDEYNVVLRNHVHLSSPSDLFKEQRGRRRLPSAAPRANDFALQYLYASKLSPASDKIN